MINAFQLKNNQLARVEFAEPTDLKAALWIDLVEPQESEREFVKQQLGQPLATRPELDDIEASARCFEDNHGLHIHSFFYYSEAMERVSGNTTVAFTIHNDRLYTLRERDLPAFRLYRMRIRMQTLVSGNAYELLLDLFETKIEQLANEIETVYSDLELSSRIILRSKQGEQFDNALSTLAEQEDIGWKVRLCLMDTQRALNFLLRRAGMERQQLAQARDILQDIESLLPHNEALFQKVNFLQQAAMGIINIEQNRIIKMFSVVSVMFLPPTLVASCYGMNFSHMPELNLRFGYPMALVIMFLVALAPYLYFKRKGWL